MDIKLLVSGCQRCLDLEKHVNEAISQLGLEATVDIINDKSVISQYGTPATPGLVVNEEVVSSGNPLSVSEVKLLLE